AMGFSMDMFTVLFAIPRTAGWLAQWEEMLLDPEQKIARPRQVYVGEDPRDYVPLERRQEATRPGDPGRAEEGSVTLPGAGRILAGAGGSGERGRAR
ncbi:MAG TPA: citrate/2-methylcitrate synthase, partial [Candidatus Methylomirabilis sp.]|nr:citrate/2-methylcitrate synthase [Candidatus Methylomirabilis sp.]